jgi:hypothetical protein
VEDVVIGAGEADVDTLSDAGQAYIIFGNANGIAHPFDLSSVDGVNGTVINGPYDESYIGFSVSGAGDINGDGFDDVIVSAGSYAFPPYDVAGTFVVFGFDNQTRTQISPLDLDGDNGFVFLDTVGVFNAGSMSGAGDFNGDGLDDIMTSDDYADANGRQNAGITYVVFGKQDNTVGLAQPAETAHTGNMRLYPNPVHNQLMLASPLLENGPDPVDVIIYDASGRRYTTPWQRNGQALQLDVSGLENGVYLLHLSSEGESAHRYFIKQ